jgi:N-(2-amino-2-carboxyethyl)-L-glutamate synthase
MLLRRGKHLLLDRIGRLRAGLGETPLLPLPDDDLDLVTKLELCNPTGSTKDRSALWILERAIRRGDITSDTTVVESSSGNFAISLASYCRMLGIAFVPVIDPNCNAPTEAYLRTLCARVEKVTQRDTTGGFLNTRLARVRELVADLPDAYWTNQYANLDALDAHYRFTAGELCRALTKIDYLFVGVGTAGTLAGLSLRVKEAFPRCTVVAVDTAGSAIFGGPRKARHIPGIGSSIVPPLCAHALIDDVLIVPEPWAVRGCHELFERHGLYAGGSTGSVYTAIRAYFTEHAPVVRRPAVVFLAADRGHAYADTVYDPAWVRRLTDDEPVTALPAGTPALRVGGEELAWTS